MFLLILRIIVVVFFLPHLVIAEDYNAFGGIKSLQNKGQIYFYLKQIDDVWWLIDPAGNGFISKGINNISFRGNGSFSNNQNPYYQSNLEAYQTQDAWADVAIQRLKQWHFNTLGAWSSTLLTTRKVPYILNLEIAKKASLAWGNKQFPDVFSDKFNRFAKRIVRLECKPRRQDLFLIGYFTDHYLVWNYELSSKSILETYLSQDSDTEGFQAAITFLENKYITIDQLNKCWDTEISAFSLLPKAMPFPQSEMRAHDQKEFLFLVANQYFKVCYKQIKAYDSNHLIFGNRINLDSPTPVLQALGEYTDVVSVNIYEEKFPANQLALIHDITNKPLLVSEFTYLHQKSSDKNPAIAYNSAELQKKRASFYEQFVTDALRLPFVIGYHWYQYTDHPIEQHQPSQNYGLVNLEDIPYNQFVEQVNQVNMKAEMIHLQIE